MALVDLVYDNLITSLFTVLIIIFTTVALYFVFKVSKKNFQVDSNKSALQFKNNCYILNYYLD